MAESEAERRAPTDAELDELDARCRAADERVAIASARVAALDAWHERHDPLDATFQRWNLRAFGACMLACGAALGTFLHSNWLLIGLLSLAAYTLGRSTAAWRRAMKSLAESPSRE